MNWKGVLKQKLWIGDDGLPNHSSNGIPSLFWVRSQPNKGGHICKFARWTRMKGGRPN